MRATSVPVRWRLRLSAVLNSVSFGFVLFGRRGCFAEPSDVKRVVVVVVVVVVVAVVVVVVAQTAMGYRDFTK